MLESRTKEEGTFRVIGIGSALKLIPNCGCLKQRELNNLGAANTSGKQECSVPSNPIESMMQGSEFGLLRGKVIPSLGYGDCLNYKTLSC
jgi:hypothetical protein